MRSSMPVVMADMKNGAALQICKFFFIFCFISNNGFLPRLAPKKIHVKSIEGYRNEDIDYSFDGTYYVCFCCCCFKNTNLESLKEKARKTKNKKRYRAPK